MAGVLKNDTQDFNIYTLYIYIYMGNDTGQVSESYIGLLSKAKFRQWTKTVDK